MGAKKHTENSKEDKYLHRLEDVLKGINLSILTLDYQWRYTYINDKALAYLNTQKEKVLGKTIWELFPELTGTQDEIEYRKVMTQRVATQFRAFNHSLARWFEVYAYPIQEGIAIQATDITERKRIEDISHENEEKFRLVATNITDILFFQDRELRYTWIFNPADPLHVSQVVGKTDADLLPPEEAERLTEIKQQVLATGTEVKLELQLSPGGITRRYEAVYKPFRSTEGQILGVVSISRDITEAKKAEEELRVREAQLDAFFANSPVILNLVDENFCYINTDKLTPTYYGLNRETIKGKCVPDLSPDFMEQTGGVMRRVIETGEPVLNAQFQSPVIGRGGEVAYLEHFLFPRPHRRWQVGSGRY